MLIIHKASYIHTTPRLDTAMLLVWHERGEERIVSFPPCIRDLFYLWKYEIVPFSSKL